MKSISFARLVAAGAAVLALGLMPQDSHAQRGRGRPGSGAASLPQVQCATGAPEATTFAAAAQDALNRTMVVRENARSPFYTTAVDNARQGIAANELNPYHHFLMGRGQLGLGNYAAADSAFRRTLELCPEFGGEVRGERRGAYQTIFAQGMESFNANDTTAAIARWEVAGQVYNEVPEVFFNIGMLSMARGDHARGVANFREVLASSDRAVAAGVDSALLAELPALRAQAMTGIRGAGLRAFQDDSVRLAHQLLTEVARANPNDRTAAYYATIALFRMERWADVIPAARQVLEMDPLTENVYLLISNSQQRLATAARAANNAAAEREVRLAMVATLARVDSLPIMLSDVGTNNTHVVVEVIKGTAAPGTPFTLEFTLYGPAGERTVPVNVVAAAEGANTRAEVALPVVDGEPMIVTGFRYRLVR